MSLKTLCDYEHMLPEAVAQNYISSSEVEFLQAWRKDPANWGR